MDNLRSLFITNKHDLMSNRPGGVQICSNEYLSAVKEFSGDVEIKFVDVATDAKSRISRRLFRKSYNLYSVKNYESEIKQTLIGKNFDIVFINKLELMGFARIVADSTHAPIVLLSHGADSGDMLHEVTSGAQNYRAPLLSTKANELGQTLIAERRFRMSVGRERCKFVVMSEEEAVFERWLGAQEPFVFPRIINPDPIDWSPHNDKIGFIGTLNHPPNIDALAAISEDLATRNTKVKIEVIGGPAGVGSEFQRRHPNVVYCGALSEAAARQRMSTWSLFLNPVFWLSRGASMKLKTALELGIPAITTRSGRRGYVLPDDVVAQSPDNLDSFCREVCNLMSEPARLKELRTKLVHENTAYPTFHSVAKDLQKWIESSN